jgi:hypothetical protein
MGGTPAKVILFPRVVYGNGDGTGTNGNISRETKSMPGIRQDEYGELHFAEWNCRAGQNNLIIRTDGTVAPCFPMYASNL